MISKKVPISCATVCKHNTTKHTISIEYFIRNKNDSSLNMKINSIFIDKFVFKFVHDMHSYASFSISIKSTSIDSSSISSSSTATFDVSVHSGIGNT